MGVSNRSPRETKSARAARGIGRHMASSVPCESRCDCRSLLALIFVVSLGRAEPFIPDWAQAAPVKGIAVVDR
jgi:hypothetical protein